MAESSERATEQSFAALGRTVTSARTLERQAYDVARAVAVLDPEKMQVTDALKRAKREVRMGLPPWSRGIERTEVLEWADRAVEVFHHRNQFVHWHPFLRNEGEGFVAYHASLRTGKQSLYEPEQLELVTKRADEAFAVGQSIFHALVFEVRDGVYHWHPGLGPEGRQWTPMVYYRGEELGWPERPTDQELDDWFRRFVAESPPEWHSWPAARHAAQRRRK